MTDVNCFNALPLVSCTASLPDMEQTFFIKPEQYTSILTEVKRKNYRRELFLKIFKKMSIEKVNAHGEKEV